LLVELGIKYKSDWKRVAKRFFIIQKIKKTPGFLKKRFKELNKTVTKGVRFTHEEDLLLSKCIVDYNRNWEKIVVEFPNRTIMMLRNRYYSFLKKNNVLNNLLKEQEKLTNNGAISYKFLQ